MKVDECQIGDQVLVPITADGYFSYDYDGELMKKNSTLLITILAPGSSSTTYYIGWKDDKAPNANGLRILKDDRPELQAQYPKLNFSTNLQQVVPCKMVKRASDKTSSTSPGFLLAMIGMGALASSLALSTSTTKEIRREAR